MNITEFQTQLPIGGNRNGYLKFITQGRKTILYAHPALLKEISDFLSKAGVEIYRLFHSPTEVKQWVIEDFLRSEKGVLVTSLHHNVGYTAGASLVVFVELHVPRNSAMVAQAIARARCADVTVQFVNCNVKYPILKPIVNSRRDLKTVTDMLAGPKPKKRGRKPFIYWKAEAWHVKVGRWTNSFKNWEDARAWAIHHHKNSNDYNWQLARFLKGFGNVGINPKLRDRQAAEAVEKLRKLLPKLRPYQLAGLKHFETLPSPRFFHTPQFGKAPLVSVDTETLPRTQVFSTHAE